MKLVAKSELIKKLPAKDMFDEVTDGRREEKGMSPFIVEHIDEISKITGYDLEVIATEEFVGPFRADIVCKDTETGEIVIIENQFDESDHDHLGKCLTYLSNLGAKAVVWINEKFRPEHKKALEVLNEITDESYHFYGLTLSHMLVGTTHAYEFGEVVVPDTVNKIANQLKMSEAAMFRHNQYADFLTTIKPKIEVFATNKFRLGKPGTLWGAVKLNKFVTLSITKLKGQNSLAITLEGNRDADGVYYDPAVEAEEKKLSEKLGIELIPHVGEHNDTRRWYILAEYSYEETPSEVMDIIVEAYRKIYTILK